MLINAVKILPYGNRAIRQINVTTIRPHNMCTLSGDTFAMVENGYWKPTYEAITRCTCDDNTCALCEFERFWG